jgi:hypothetical protein
MTLISDFKLETLSNRENPAVALLLPSILKAMTPLFSVFQKSWNATTLHHVARQQSNDSSST